MRVLRTLLKGKQALDSPQSLGAQLYAALLRPSVLAEALGLCQLEDTLQGRFAAVSLCAAVVLHRPPQGPSALAHALQEALRADATATRAALERELVGAMVQDIDTAFREHSLGDATVKKHAKNHAAALYGRLRAYAAMLAGQGEPAEQVLRRNLYANSPTQGQVAALADLLPKLEGLIGTSL